MVYFALTKEHKSLLNKNCREIVVMLGIALANRDLKKESKLIYETLDWIIPDNDLLLWFQATYDLLLGDIHKAIRKLRSCSLQEAVKLLDIIENNL